jgi:hypothetical protein
VRKRKVNYPPAKTANRPPPPTGLPNDAPMVRPTVATIDLTAGKGRAGLTVGGRVRISGTGLYSGEIAVIEKLVTGVIPQAVVRTEAGKTRQVRTIDLEPVAANVTNAPPPPVAAPAPAPVPATPPAASADPGPPEA